MLMKVFSIFDDKSLTYSKPFYELTLGSAIRVFTDAAADPQSAFARHPADYSLFHIGQFNDETAVLDRVEPKNLGNALQYISTEKEN